MPRVTSMLTDFTAGEVSPLIEGQIDLKQYFSGARDVENLVPLPHGPLKKRGGTAFVAATKATEGAHRLIPFQFNVTQSYVLEFGDQYIRFFSERGQVITSNQAYEIESPYLESDLEDLNYTQSADVLILVHPDYPPMELLRNGHTDWTLQEITFTNPPVYDDPDDDSEDPAQLYYWDSQNGYPGVVTFYEQRLVFAASRAFPQTLWFSVIGIYYEFTVSEDGADDDAFAYTIASDQVNAIRWLLSGEYLLMGTKGGEFRIYSGTSTEALTPSNVKAVRQSNHGSDEARALLIESSALFVQFGGRKVRNMKYDVLTEAYEAEDISMLAEHITKSGIKETAYQNNPDPIFWAALNDGTLVGCTYEAIQKVIAWHHHYIAGEYQDGIAVVESIASIDDSAGDELWMIVKRTINGEDVKYVEYLADHLRSTVEETDRCYLDSFIANTFTEDTTTLSNLDHLIGQTIVPVVDGWVHVPVVVDENGEVELQVGGKDIKVGLLYKARYRSMRIQARYSDFISYHMEKRLVRCWISVYESLGLWVGVDGDEIQEQLMGGLRVMGEARELISDDVEVDIEGTTSTDARLVIESQIPRPLTILGIVYDLEVSEV